MKISTTQINLFIFSFLVLFFIIWKTNIYFFIGREEIYIKSLIENINILSTDNNFTFVGNEEDRKFFRKYNKFLLSFFYAQINHILPYFNLDSNLLIYFHYALISFTLSGGIFFTLKCVEKISNANTYVIWIYILSTVSYISVIGGIPELFSPFEFFFISGCLYFSMNKKVIMFILFSFLAVANRETGILTFFIYFLFNKKNLKTFLISISPIIFFILSNVSFFLEYPFSYGKIIFVSSDLNLFDIFSMNKKKAIGSLFFTLIIYCPLINCVKQYKIFTNLNHNLLFFLYIITVNFGTFVGNLYPQLIVVPFLTLIFFGKKLRTPIKLN